MIAGIMTNKNFQAIIKELFIRCRKLNISLAFILQFYFSVTKEVRLNSTHYLIMQIHNKRELQQIAGIDYKDFLKIYRKYISELYSFLTIDTTLPSNNSLRFRKNLLDPLLKRHYVLKSRLKQINFSMIQTEKQLKFLHYHLKNWIIMNI